MSKLLKEWNRLAYNKGTRTMNEGMGEDPGLKQLESMGFFFAGADTVVLGDLDDMSDKEFKYEYPCDDPYEQGAFHVQVSVERDGTYRIHDYGSVEPEFVSYYPIDPNAGRRGTSFNTVEEVQQAVRQMVVAYEEFMEVYEQARVLGAIVDEYYPAIDVNHPAIQHLKKH